MYINGKKYSESYLDDKKKKLTIDEPLTYDFDIKTLPSTVSEVVLEGYYFVLGDNRRNSEDSRSIGFVSADNIIGKASVGFLGL